MKQDGYKIISETINKSEKKRKSKIKTTIAGILVVGVLALSIILIRKRIKKLNLQKMNSKKREVLLKIEKVKLHRLKQKAINEEKLRRYLEKSIGQKINKGENLSSVIKAIRDDAKSDADIAKKFRMIAKLSKGRYKVFTPKVGNAFEDRKMLSFTKNIWSPADAKITKVVYPGLYDTLTKKMVSSAAVLASG